MSPSSAIDPPIRRADVVWGLLAVSLLLAPLLAFQQFPSQDGPSHLNSAIALKGLAEGRAPFVDYFFEKPIDPTNTAVTAILAGLARVAPMDEIGRLYAGLYVLAFCGAAWLCVRRLLKAGVVTFLLLCALVFSHMLHMGSYNLTLAYIGFLAVISFSCAHLRQPRLVTAAAIGAALVVTYGLHVQVALLAALCVAITGAGLVLRGWSGSADARASRLWLGLRQAGLLALSGLPTAVLFLVFYIRNAEGLEAVSHLSHVGLVGKIKHLGLLSGIANYSVFGLAVTAMLAVLLIILSVVAFRAPHRFGLRPHDVLGAFALALTAIYFVIPNGLGEALNIEERVMIPLLMTLVCWIGVSTPLAASSRIAAAALALLALQTADRAVAFQRFNVQAVEALPLRACIPAGSALFYVDLDLVARLPVDRDWRRPFASTLRFEPFANLGGSILADRPAAWVNNYEAEVTRPYFALKQQPWLLDLLGPENVTFALWREGQDGAFTRLADQLPGARHPIDYLILWSNDPRALAEPRVMAAWRGVRSRYQEVAATPDRSAVLLRLKAAQGLAGPSCPLKGESPA